MKADNYHLEWSNEKSRILSFLIEVDSFFYEPLSTRIKLAEYSEKLSANAKNLFLVLDGQDIAHVALYENKLEKSVFISSISVKKNNQGAGIGTYILEVLKNYVNKAGIEVIKLEADSRSEKLCDFYKKNGFILENISNHKAYMLYKLGK